MGWLDSCFEDLADPRTGNAKRHKLLNLLTIALTAAICGAETCVDFADFARDRAALFSEFLDMEGGLPSHDTFSRLFRLLDPAGFATCFAYFVAKLGDVGAGVLAIDGKTLRRSRECQALCVGRFPWLPSPQGRPTMKDIRPEVLDELLSGYEKPSDLLGEDGIFRQLKKRLLERALNAELSEHVGHEKGARSGRRGANNRSGHTAKTVLTDEGAVTLSVPRDRDGTFEPAIVPKGVTRLAGFGAQVISLHARGLSVRDVQAHLRGGGLARPDQPCDRRGA